ncbi:MAG: hypothetical protein QXD23_03685, partial [Candidatus Micrarchaeaceae archaeon]
FGKILVVYSKPNAIFVRNKKNKLNNKKRTQFNNLCFKEILSFRVIFFSFFNNFLGVSMLLVN